MASAKDKLTPHDIRSILGPKNASRYGKIILKTVDKGLSDERPLPQRKHLDSIRISGQDVLTAALKDWREEVHRKGMRLALLPSNVQIRKISAAVPITADELCSVMRQWQYNRYGEELLKILTPISTKWKNYVPKKQRRAMNKK